TVSVPADGTTSTLYTITNATPNAILDVTSLLGKITSTDTGTTYAGFQVTANASGTATFSITSPTSTAPQTSTISIAEVTGLKIGVFTQVYDGVVSPPPPGVPPAATYQGF